MDPCRKRSLAAIALPTSLSASNASFVGVCIACDLHLFRCLAGRLYNMPMQESFLMS